MKKIILIILFFVLCGVAAYFISPSQFSSLTGITPRLLGDSAPTESTYVVPEFKGEEYRNTLYGFSLALPEGFTPSELSNDEGGQTIVLQDPQGNGIQIHVTPFPDDLRVLSADMVRSDIPDMQVTGEQEVEIGPEHKGVAFLSDNEAFEGASREVWFVFRGNLYQISTYARLDNLLQSMFGTWKFL